MASGKEDLYSFDELKQVMGVDSTHLFELIHRHCIKAETIDNQLYFSKKEVRKMVLAK